MSEREMVSADGRRAHAAEMSKSLADARGWTTRDSWATTVPRRGCARDRGRTRRGRQGHPRLMVADHAAGAASTDAACRDGATGRSTRSARPTPPTHVRAESQRSARRNANATGACEIIEGRNDGLRTDAGSYARRSVADKPTTARWW